MQRVVSSCTDACGAKRQDACGKSEDTVKDWCNAESPRFQPEFSAAVTRARDSVRGRVNTTKTTRPTRAGRGVRVVKQKMLLCRSDSLRFHPEFLAAVTRVRGRCGDNGAGVRRG